MTGRLLCKIGLHRPLIRSSSALGGGVVTTVRARACARGCGSFELTAIRQTAIRHFPAVGSDLTAEALDAYAEMARRHPRHRPDPSTFSGGDLLVAISREVWSALPERLQWALLAIDDCEAGLFPAAGLPSRLEAIEHGHALLARFRAG